MVETFKQFKSEQYGNLFEKQIKSKNEMIIWSNYGIVNQISCENKSFSNGEVFKKCIFRSIKEIAHTISFFYFKIIVIFEYTIKLSI